MKHRLLSLCISLMIVLTMAVPVFADVDATTMRHSVVYVEVGCQGRAGFLGIAGGTGFFIGEADTNPSIILTNYHVISTFIDLGKGNQLTNNAFRYFLYWVVESILGMPSQTFNGLSEEEQAAIIQNIYNSLWIKFAGEDTDASFRSMIRVYYDDNDYEEAYLVDQGDYTKDMALLRLDKPTDKRVPIAVCEPSEEMVRGSVTAIGYPSSSGSIFDPVSEKGENDSTVTAGTVSRLQTETGTGLRIVQYDASINHGNSGGPLIFDENGAVIALNTWSTGADSNMFFGVSMSEVIPMLNRNNVSYEFKQYPVTTTTEEETEITSTEPTTEETSTESNGITIFGHNFTHTQFILAVLGLIALIVAIVFFVRHFKAKEEEEKRRKEEEERRREEEIRRKEEEERRKEEERIRKEKERSIIEDPPPAPSDPNDSLFRIQCVGGTLGSRRIAIPRTGQIVMGRNDDCGIVFPSSTKGVSGRHCAVYYESGSVYVRDIGSTYGTFIEPGRRLSANEAVAVPEGRKFWLGSENECFRIERKNH